MPISLPMPTCLIHAVFDLWRIKINEKLAFLIFEDRSYLEYEKTRLQFQKMYFWIVLLQICINHSHTHSQWTCGLWDVKQMIFVHDYLKLMDKIWPLSALHLHHRRTSTNDRSRKAELLISSSSYHCTTILLSILQSHIIVYTVNHWRQFNKRIYLQMPISIFLQFIFNKFVMLWIFSLNIWPWWYLFSPVE